MEISLANSQQDIITAINKLETIGYVTEFDKILNNLPHSQLEISNSN